MDTAKEISLEEKKAAYLASMDNNRSLDRLLQTAEDFGNGIKKEVWETGFEQLDKMLDGGLHGSQLCCIGAISSLGKTSFTLQMATQMAEKGHDVLIFSLEMSREELNAKTVSRYSLIGYEEKARKVITGGPDVWCFTTFDILKGDVGHSNKVRYAAYLEALERTRKVAGHTYIIEGNNDISVDQIEEITKTHIELTGRKPVVILDYLQILSCSKHAADNHFDVRRSTNDDVTALKVIARTLDIPVVAISAFNRASYLDPVNMASFRESSGIEYSADVLFGLSYSLQQTGVGTSAPSDNSKKDGSQDAQMLKLLDDMQKRAAEGKNQTVELKILKNRNGSKGSISFEFFPKYNFFVETDSAGYFTAIFCSDEMKNSLKTNKQRRSI